MLATHTSDSEKALCRVAQALEPSELRVQTLNTNKSNDRTTLSLLAATWSHND
jgi:hypothetical protein